MVNAHICVSACNKCYIKCKTELANCLCCLYGSPEWPDIKCFLKCHHPPTLKIFMHSFFKDFTRQLMTLMFNNMGGKPNGKIQLFDDPEVNSNI